MIISLRKPLLRVKKMSFNTHTILKGKNNALVHWKGYYVTISLRIY